MASSPLGQVTIPSWRFSESLYLGGHGLPLVNPYSNLPLAAWLPIRFGSGGLWHDLE